MNTTVTLRGPPRCGQEQTVAAIGPFGFIVRPGEKLKPQGLRKEKENGHDQFTR
jgi:hypothetical protein